MKGRFTGWALAACVLAAGAGCAAQPAPRDVEQRSLFAAGEAAENRGDYDQALVQYVQFLGSDPENAEAHYRIGRVHQALGNTAVAHDAFLRALAKDPNHIGAMEGLGLLSLEQGQHQVAASLLHKVLARDAARWRAYNGLGVLADLDSKHDLAQAYFGAARKLKPDDSSIVNNIGYSRYLSGNLKGAQRDFESAIALDSKNQKAWSNLGLVLARMSNYPKAVLTLEHIMSPKEARYSVGYIAMLDGKLEAAEDLFKDSIRLSPTYDPAAQAALKRVHEEQLRRRH